MNKVISFIRRETVLCAALTLAVISSFFVLPDIEYIKYIDFRTLSILLSLMTVMAGLKETGMFEFLAHGMLSKVKNTRQLVLILVMLCFFFSMLITNDVALITFVPLTFIALDLSGQKSKLFIPVVALQTTAANLGSMLTPIGNPQNLYLYSRSDMALLEFIKITFPYTALSLILLIICCVFFKAKKTQSLSNKSMINNKRQTVIYLALFILCLLTVARIIPYVITLAIVVLITFITDKHTLKNVDYSLLLTFVGFFIFIGNMGRINSFCEFLKSIIANHEVITSVASSQIISNVPAALLLSGFTENIDKLIIGTNLGGLGTLIASMASLISFKYIAREDKSLRGKYILYFSIVNIVFLGILLGLYFVL